MECCGDGEYVARRRTNGFMRPFTTDQVLSWVAEPFAAVLFYLWVLTFTSGSEKSGLVAVYSALLVAHLTCWVQCSRLDPASDEGMFWPCLMESQKEKRYCYSCQKNVPGLDHHCTWLNTCIGKRQYPYFFFLIMIGSLMYWFETCVLIALVIPNSGLRTEASDSKAEAVLGSTTTYTVLLSLSVCVVAPIACGLTFLFGFHIYLQIIGLTTYDYLMGKRTQKRDKKSAESKKVCCFGASTRDEAPQKEPAAIELSQVNNSPGREYAANSAESIPDVDVPKTAEQPPFPPVQREASIGGNGNGLDQGQLASA